MDFFSSQKEQPSLYGTILLHLLGNTGKYSLSCKTHTENQLFQYCPTRKDKTRSILLVIENVCIGYTVKYSLSPWEIPWAPPLGFPSCSGYISLYIPPLVIIRIQIIIKNGIMRFNSFNITFKQGYISQDPF